MRSRSLAAAGLLAAGALIGTAAPVRAQVVYPLQNPSVRSAGMGGASAAVVWSGDRNPWANPALLGYASGLTVRWTRADLFYSEPPVRFRAGDVEYGWGGLGFSYGHDGIRLELLLTDAFGNPLGTAEISNRVRHWGGALSVARVVEKVRGAGSPPGILRHADLALGFARKRGDYFYGFSFGGSGRTDEATDFGLLARVTPLPETPGRRSSVDLTYGYSELEEPSDPLPNGGFSHHRRHGIGARIGKRLGAGGPGDPGPRFIAWLARGGDPILAMTIAADFDRYRRTGPFSGPPTQTAREIGAEFSYADALALRVGHVRADVQGLDSFCFGAGIAVPVADVMRLRYDYARFPSNGYDDQKSGNRHAFSLWFDTSAMVRR